MTSSLKSKDKEIIVARSGFKNMHEQKKPEKAAFSSFAGIVQEDIPGRC
jgi:hypothetical protein